MGVSDQIRVNRESLREGLFICPRMRYQAEGIPDPRIQPKRRPSFPARGDWVFFLMVVLREEDQEAFFGRPRFLGAGASVSRGSSAGCGSTGGSGTNAEGMASGLNADTVLRAAMIA